MFASAIIVFREVLEAALLIGIMAAATRGIPGRSRWLAGGIVAGLAGAGLLAAFAGRLAELASGMGQELFNAAVLSVAVTMLAWHNIWMASHGAAMAADARRVGNSVKGGSQELSILLVVIGLAVLREGAETALFLYGIATSGGDSSAALFSGGVLGVVSGVTVGWLLYAGLLRIPLRWFFGATSLLVLLLAAGMASQIAHFLVQADFLPTLAEPLWDSSALLPQSSVLGTLLHSLIGYDDQPAGIQAVFYLTAFAVIYGAMRRAKRTAPALRTA